MIMPAGSECYYNDGIICMGANIMMALFEVQVRGCQIQK